MNIELLSHRRRNMLESMRQSLLARKVQQSLFKRPAVSGCLAMLAIVGVVLIRTINLGSDAPRGLPAEEDYGIYVDEGYKTLSARNMVTFGKARWHSGDDYPGWVNASPITQSAFYLGFAMFGQNLETARVVSVTWFALFLIAFDIAYYHYRSSPLFWVGLLMLGFQHVLWVLSRTAIFEVAALSIFYAALLLLRRFSSAAIPNAIVIILIGMMVTFGIKQDAPVIVAPALFGILTVWAVQKARMKQFLIFLVIAAGVLFLLSYLQRIGLDVPLGTPLKRISLFSPVMEIRRVLVNPILEADPFVVILVHACAISVLLHRPKFFENNSYRASLMSIVFLGTGALATVPKIQLRYCALLLPAFILLLVEWWIAQKQNSSPLPRCKKQQLSTYAVIVVVFLLTYDLVFLVSSSLSLFLDISGAGRHTPSLKLPIAAALAFLVWRKRDALLSASVLRAFIFASMAAFALFNSYKVANSLARPTWQVRTVSNQLDRILPRGATVAGDWIPLFAIGTNLPVLYTNRVFNRPARFWDLRPSHFLYCDTQGGKIVKGIIEKFDWVKLGPPLFESEYTGIQVTLYPLHYRDSELRRPAENEP
jgi:hypothetical protein